MRIGTVIKLAKEYMPDLDDERLLEAYEFARDAHGDQKRNDGSPYIMHPLSTCAILLNYKVDEDTLITALLHDVPEDTNATIKDIEKHFGKKVAYLVQGVTKLSKVYYKHNMAERQIESLKRLFIHSAEDLRIILVKLADRLHNMRTLEFVSIPGKRLRISKETLEIYVPIANLLGIWEIKSEMEDLCFKYIYPTDYEKTRELVETSALQNDNILKSTVRKIQSVLKSKRIKAKIQARRKSLYSIFKKMLHTGKTFHDIYDLIALRIIVTNIDNCYRTLGIIHQTFRPKHKRIKDYIAVPKVNGYQSLHTTVFGIDGTITEFQIRTETMHLESEYGIAAHYFYDLSRSAAKDKETMPAIFSKHAEWAKKVLAIQKEVSSDYDFVASLKFDVFQDRIFSFTPKGDVIDLPFGANAIDFAYHIHTDVGDHAVSADVSGEYLPLSTQLKTGDTVKIITDPKAHPDREWLSIVKTSHARTKIKEYFKRQGSTKNYKAGLQLINSELAMFGYDKLKKPTSEVLQTIFEKFNVTNMKGLIVSVGDGTINVKNMIHGFYTDEELLGKPAVTDNITNKDLLSRHRMDRAMSIVLGNEELSEKAAYEALQIYRVNVSIDANDRVGMLLDIAMKLSRLGVNIYKVGVSNTPKKHVKKMLLKIEVYDLDHFDRAVRAIKSIKDVIRVYKDR